MNEPKNLHVRPMDMNKGEEKDAGGWRSAGWR